MTDPDPRNQGFYWSTLFFRALYYNGVRNVVISPGSRSTPLTLAAAAHTGLNKYVVLDERSAAFMALGMSKASGIPAVLICTSGTAPANYFPAVIEAKLSGIPLILATADRPPNLRSTGANQAADQLKMFGDYTIFHHEVGEPRFDDVDLNRLNMLARQSVDSALELKGPVHLNFPFRKPLEPQPEFLAAIEQENKNLTQDVNVSPSLHPSILDLSPDIRHLIEKSVNPLIVAGPLANLSAAKTIEDLADTIQAPILNEGGFTTCNTVKGYEGFLRHKKERDKLQPDLIIRFGFQPTGKAVEQALDQWRDIPHIHFASTDSWQDATFSVTHRVSWREQPVKWNMQQRSRSNWLDKWRSFEEEFISQVQAGLSGPAALTDLHVYHHLGPQVPEDWTIFLSNSFPARDSLLAGRFQTASVYLNRGASGIDGITSTAMGVNLALDRPTVLFTGDLAFLHDTNALLSHRLLRQPLIIVVINNDGGNIFRMLPIAQHTTYYRDYFETPQKVEIAAMAKTYDVAYTQVKNIHGLSRINLVDVAERTEKNVHIIECRTDSEASMTLRNSLWSDRHVN